MNNGNGHTLSFTNPEDWNINNRQDGPNTNGNGAGYAATTGTGAGYATSTKDFQDLGQEDDRKYIVPSANPPPCQEQGPYKCVLPTYNNKNIAPAQSASQRWLAGARRHRPLAKGCPLPFAHSLYHGRSSWRRKGQEKETA